VKLLNEVVDFGVILDRESVLQSIRCVVGREKIRSRAESIGTSKPQNLQKRKVEAGSTVHNC